RQVAHQRDALATNAQVGAVPGAAGAVDHHGALDLEVEHLAHARGRAVKPRMRSHQAATPSSRVVPPGAWTSWIARGRPAPSRPVGSVIDGTPAELHGAQSEASPVHPRPAGAGPGAVGDNSASCASSSGIIVSRNASRARLATTYSMAGRRS